MANRFAFRDPDHEEYDCGHHRRERRRTWIADIPDGALTGGFAHARQAIRIERTVTKDGRTTTSNAYAISSRGAEHATAQDLAGFIRGHWSIENKIHYVRDVTFDEDRHRARNGQRPVVLATMRNLAIAILRLDKHQYIPDGLRKCILDLSYTVKLLSGKGIGL